jgi:hypothetical protein
MIENRVRQVLVRVLLVMMVASLVLAAASFVRPTVVKADVSCTCTPKYLLCPPGGACLPKGTVYKYYWCNDGYGHYWWGSPCGYYCMWCT